MASPIDEVRQQLTLDISQALKGLQDGIKALKDMLGNLQLVQSGLSAMRNAWREAASALSSGSGGAIALFGGIGAAVRQLYDQLKQSSVIQTFTRHIGELATLGKTGFSALGEAAKSGLASLAQGISGYTASLQQVQTDLRTFATSNQRTVSDLQNVGQAATGAAKGFDAYRSAVFLIGEFLAQNVAQSFADFSLLLSDKLAPDMTAVTGEAVKQSAAVNQLNATYQQFARILQQSQQQAFAPLSDGLASIREALIPTNEGFVKVIASAGAYGSALAGLIGTVGQLVPTLIVLGQTIQIVNFALKQEFVLSFIRSLGVATNGVKGLTDVFRLLKDILIASIASGFNALKELLTVGVPAAINATKAGIVSLAAAMGMTPGGLALIAGTVLVGAFVALAAAFRNTTVEVNNYNAAVAKIAKRDKGLADIITAEQEQLRLQNQLARVEVKQQLGSPEAGEDAAILRTKQQILALERERERVNALIADATKEEKIAIEAQNNALIAQQEGYRIISGIVEGMDAAIARQTQEISRQAEARKRNLGDKEVANMREMQRISEQLAILEGKGPQVTQERLALQERLRGLQADQVRIAREATEIDVEARRSIVATLENAVRQVDAEKQRRDLLFTLEEQERKISEELEKQLKIREKLNQGKREEKEGIGGIFDLLPQSDLLAPPEAQLANAKAFDQARLEANEKLVDALKRQQENLRASKQEIVELLANVTRYEVGLEDANTQLEAGTGEIKKQQLQEEALRSTASQVAQNYALQRQQLEFATRALEVRNTLAVRRAALEGQSLELQRQTNEYEIQSAQNQEDTLANRKRVFDLQRRSLELDRDIIESRRRVIDAEARGIRDVLGKLEEKKKLEEQNGDLREETVLLIEQENQRLDETVAKYKGLDVALGGINSQMGDLNKNIQRLGQVPINFGQVFTQAMNDGLDALVLGTREWGDVFEGMKYSVLQTFTNMFAQMVQQKLKFDTLWQNNWLKDIPSAVAGGVQKAGGFLSQLLSGNFSGALGSIGNGISSLFSSNLGSGAALSLGGQLIGGPIGTGLSTAGLLGNILPGFSTGASFGGFFDTLKLLPTNFNTGGLGGILGTLGDAFGQLGPIAGLSGLGTAFFGGGSPIGRSLAGVGGILSLGAGGFLGSGLATMLAAVPGLQFAAPLLALAGPLLSMLNKPGRIFLERKRIAGFLEQQYGIDVPLKKTSKYLPQGEIKFDEEEAGLETLGTIFALGDKKGGIGTAKRFGNLSQAAFEKAGLDTEGARQEILELAQAMNVDLKSALDSINKALSGGFKDKKNQLSLKEYMEEVKEGQEDILTLNKLLKGTLDIVTEFSDEFDTAKIANNLLAKQFEESAEKTGFYNEEVAKLAESIKSGTIPIEEAIIQLNKMREAAGLNSLELKDFKLNIDSMRVDLLKMGIVADEKAQRIVDLGDAIDQAAERVKAFDEAIKQINQSIDDLRIAKLEQAFKLSSAIATARGRDPLETLANERTQFIRPALGRVLGGINTDWINDLEDLKAQFGLSSTRVIAPGYVGDISDLALPIDQRPGRTVGPTSISSLNSAQLGQVSGLVDRLSANVTNEFQVRFAQAQERIGKQLEKDLEALQKSARERAEQLKDAAQGAAEAAREAAEASIRAHQERIEQIRTEGQVYQKAQNEKLKGLQEELQLAQAFAQLAQQIKASLQGLLTSGASPLSPTEQFALISRQADITRQGGVGAVGQARLTSLSEQQRLILQQIQAIPFQRPSADYAEVFNELVRQLEELQRQAEEEGARTQSIEQQILDTQRESEQHLEELNRRIEVETEAIEREREALEEKLKNLQDQLETDIKSLEEETTKKAEELRATAEAELEKTRQELADVLETQLKALHDISVAIADRQIALLEEQRKELLEERRKAEEQRERMVTKLAELAGITREEVAEFLRQIRDALANPGSYSLDGRETRGISIPTAAPVSYSPFGSYGQTVTVQNQNNFSITPPQGTTFDPTLVARQMASIIDQQTVRSAESGRLQMATRKGLESRVI